MTLKSELAGHVAGLVDQIEQRAETLPAQARDAQKTVSAWGTRARKFAQRNPGTVLIGAFAIGFVLAKAARHA